MKRSQRLIIDVREPEEYAQGHVPGALNIPPAELIEGAKQLHDINKDMKLVLYCRTGSRSNVAKNILSSMGYTNVVNDINQGHVMARHM